MKNWEAKEIDFIRENADEMTIQDIAEYLSRTVFAITTVMKRMGLSTEYIYPKPEIQKIESTCQKQAKSMCLKPKCEWRRGDGDNIKDYCFWKKCYYERS